MLNIILFQLQGNLLYTKVTWLLLTTSVLSWTFTYTITPDQNMGYWKVQKPSWFVWVCFFVSSSYPWLLIISFIKYHFRYFLVFSQLYCFDGRGGDPITSFTAPFKPGFHPLFCFLLSLNMLFFINQKSILKHWSILCTPSSHLPYTSCPLFAWSPLPPPSPTTFLGPQSKTSCTRPNRQVTMHFKTWLQYNLWLT